MDSNSATGVIVSEDHGNRDQPETSTGQLTSGAGSKSSTALNECGSLPGGSNSSPSRDTSELKLLTRKRRLMVDMKALCNQTQCAKISDTEGLMSKFDDVKTIYESFKCAVENTITDSVLVTELLDGVADQFDQCLYSNQLMKSKFFGDPHEGNISDVSPSDSSSQVEFNCTASSSTSTASRKIELKRQRLKLKAMRDLEMAKA